MISFVELPRLQALEELPQSVIARAGGETCGAVPEIGQVGHRTSLGCLVALAVTVRAAGSPPSGVDPLVAVRLAVAGSSSSVA